MRVAIFEGSIMVSSKVNQQTLGIHDIASVTSQPIRGHMGYHILALKLQGRKSEMFLYWFPAQYVMSPIIRHVAATAISVSYGSQGSGGGGGVVVGCRKLFLLPLLLLLLIPSLSSSVVLVCPPDWSRHMHYTCMASC